MEVTEAGETLPDTSAPAPSGDTEIVDGGDDARTLVQTGEEEEITSQPKVQVGSTSTTTEALQ